MVMVVSPEVSETGTALPRCEGGRPPTSEIPASTGLSGPGVKLCKVQLHTGLFYTEGDGFLCQQGAVIFVSARRLAQSSHSHSPVLGVMST